MKYEVRITQSHIDYYQVDAKNEHEAEAFVLAQINNPKDWIYATKVDTIKRTPVVDYSLQITPEGEPLIMKPRTLTATFPDGTQVKRRTARTYVYVVGNKGRLTNGGVSWVGRPELLAARIKDFVDPVVGIVNNDNS